MNPKVLKELTEKTRALIDAPTCSSETKEAAKRWLDAVGTDAEAEETKNISPSWKKISCRSTR